MAREKVWKTAAAPWKNSEEISQTFDGLSLMYLVRFRMVGSKNCHNSAGSSSAESPAVTPTDIKQKDILQQFFFLTQIYTRNMSI